MNELTDIGTIRRLCAKYGFTLSRQFGQNFIVNPGICPKIAEACGAGPDWGVLEIGPGIGVLTRELAKRAGRVVAVEIDRRLPPLLQESLAGFDNVKVVSGDVMELDLAALLRQEFGGRPVAVCANLPYYITSPIVMKLLEDRLPLRNITVMVQKEAAQRICAVPGSREAGAISLAVRYYAQPQVLFTVSPGSFYPPPKVTSAVIRLTLLEQPPVHPRDEALYFRLVRAAFGQRRKTAVNAVSAGLGREKPEVAAAMRAAGIPELARPEQLTLEDYARLADSLTPAACVPGGGEAAAEEK